MNRVLPALAAWSGRYHHLREVTRDDVLAVLATVHGVQRSNTIVALRSLFAFCKRNGTVFRNPTGRIKVGEHGYNVIQPLRPVEVGDAVAAATTPAARLVLALAAIHAARSGAIRALRLDDVDLGNRRLVIAGRIRPLDDLDPSDPARLARPSAHPLAQHGQPAPDRQPADRDGRPARSAASG